MTSRSEVEVAEGESDVDVVIVNWNTREELLECVTSALGSIDVTAHVIVVDNASADGSADAVAQRFPEVTLIRNPTNEGVARAQRKAISFGRAPYVMILNPDTVLQPGTLAEMLARMARLPQHAVLAPRLLDEGGLPQHSAYLFPSLGISLLLATGAQRLLPESWRANLLLEGSWKSDVVRDVPWVISAAMMVRRAAIDGVGGPDERIFVYADDMEWCDRFWRAGWRTRFDPSISVVHLGNRSGAQRYGEDRVAAYMRSTIAYLRRRRGPLWTAMFYAINAAATVPRYAATRVAFRIAPTPARHARLLMWRGHARFYLRRAPEVGRH